MAHFTGFASPAADYVDTSIDLNRELIPHPSSTFIMRAAGHSDPDTGVRPGDILLVDRSLQARSGSLVVATYAGELLLKRVRAGEGAAPAEDCGDNPSAWGVVTYVIHSAAGGGSEW